MISSVTLILAIGFPMAFSAIVQLNCTGLTGPDYSVLPKCPVPVQKGIVEGQTSFTAAIKTCGGNLASGNWMTYYLLNSWYNASNDLNLQDANTVKMIVPLARFYECYFVRTGILQANGSYNSTALKTLMINAPNQAPLWGNMFGNLHSYCLTAIKAKNFAKLLVPGTTSYVSIDWFLLMQCTLYASWRSIAIAHFEKNVPYTSIFTSFATTCDPTFASFQSCRANSFFEKMLAPLAIPAFTAG
ncbi:uncharacterized protein LOC132192673 [Neocloeon triangulifer]|uniref:uncharacterized protein LOC132192673 n=1 Tax=Neocloeon triangulifer TaxID=2078957 RepID=UPI00286F157C|nr:uncharacterized protein LOC132192673 [Neocloeon triangulifer]